MRPWVLTFVLKCGQALPLLCPREEAEAMVEAYARARARLDNPGEVFTGTTTDGLKWAVGALSVQAAYCGPVQEARPPPAQPGPYQEIPWRQSSSGAQQPRW